MRGVGTQLKYYVRLINRGLWFCTNLGLGILILPPIISILKRLITGTGMTGTVEFSEYLLVAIGFLGLSYAQEIKGHIAVDIFYRLLGESFQRFMRLGGFLLSAGLAGVFTWLGFEKALHASLDMETAWFGDIIVRVWFMRWVVPIGFLALFLQCLVDMFEEVFRK